MGFQYLYWTPRPRQNIWNFLEAKYLGDMQLGLLQLLVKHGPMALDDHDWN